MPKTRKVQLSFSGGEIDTQMYGRIDAQQYQSGLATCKNWMVDPRGSLRRRPGMQRVAGSLDSTKKSRLIPFTYSVDQQLAVEFTDQKVRLHSYGGTIVWADFREFDSDGIDTTENVITFKDDHGFEDQEPIVFYAEDHDFGALPNPLTDPDGNYFVRSVDARSIKIFDAATNGNVVPLTSTGTSDKKFYAFKKGSREGYVGNARAYKRYDNSTGASATALLRLPTTVNSNFLLNFTGGTLGPGSTGIGNGVDHGDLRFFQGEAVELVDQVGNPLPGIPRPLFVDYFAAAVNTSFNFGLRTAEEYVNTQAGGRPNTWINATTLESIINNAALTVSRIHIRQYWRKGDYGYIGIPGVNTTLLHKVVRFSSATSSANASGFVGQIEDKSTEASDDGAVVIATPFTESELFDIEYDQSGDVVTLTHPNHRPHELRRYGVIEWDVSEVDFSPPLPAPTGLAGTPQRGQAYQVLDTSSPTAGVVEFTFNDPVPFTYGDTVYVRGGSSTASGYGSVADLTTSGTAVTGIQLRLPNGSPWPVPTPVGAVSDVYFYYSVSTADPDETYKVTAVDERGQESLGSDEFTVQDNILGSPGASNGLTWNSVNGALSYNVYKKFNGTFGLIGRVDTEPGATTYSFEDDDIGVDPSQSLLIEDQQVEDSFQPRASARFEQRRCFGGSPALPRTLFMSRTGTESSFSYRFPVQPDDRIAVQVASREAHVIRHIVPVQDLILMTQQGEFRVTAINSDAITPSTIAIRQQSYVGSNSVHPQIVNNSIVFCSERGGHARELNYKVENQGYLTGDLSLRAAHLFDGFTLNDLAYSKAPIPVLWFVSSSGKLLCLTYIPEERVLAWHQHETDGAIESVCSVSEGNYDNLYVIVKRGDDRSVERIVQVREETLDDAIYLDSSVCKDNINTGTSQVLITSDGRMAKGETVTVNAVAADGQTPVLDVFSTSDIGDEVEVTHGTGRYRLRLDSFIPTVERSGRIHYTGDSLGATSNTPHWDAGNVATFYDSDEHPIVNDELVRMSSTGTLPTGLSSATNYYALEVTQDASFTINSGFRGILLSSASHTLKDGEGVKISTTGTMPSELDPDQEYFVGIFGSAGFYRLYLDRINALNGSNINVVQFTGGSGTVTVRRTRSLRLQTVASSGTPVSWTGAGTGEHSVVRSVYRESSDQPHGLATGDLVRTGSDVPGGLDANTVYYVIRDSAEEFRFATSASNAEAGTAVTLTSPPSSGLLTVTVGAELSEAQCKGTLLEDWPRTLKGTPTPNWAFARKVFSGFIHLAGQTITVLTRGGKTESVTVAADGTVTLSDRVVKICGGLPYTSQAKTLPMSLEIEAGAQGRTKSVNQVFVRVEDTGALQVGMDEADLKSVTELSNTALKTGEFRTSVPSTWDEEGQIVVEATGAAPASLLNITTQVSLGD